MNYIDYFIHQAENLFKEYQERTTYVDKFDGNSYYDYKSNYSHLDFNNIVCVYDINEDNFTLQEAQNIIADICGYEKWEDLLGLSDTRFEITKLILENSKEHNLIIDDWEMYLHGIKYDNDIDDELELELLKKYLSNQDSISQ
jgi:hypothetical protein